MASITIKDLQTTGLELFQDSESYLHELKNFDDAVYGGQVAATADTATTATANPNSTAFVLEVIEKGYEFAVYTAGIEAIKNIIKSYSAGNNP